MAKDSASGYVVGVAARVVLIIFGALMAFAVIGCCLSVSGCAVFHRETAIKPEVVKIPTYVVVPIPDALLRSCDVIEPPKGCTRNGVKDFCNGQLSALLDMYRLATRQCTDDKNQIRDLSKGQ